MIPVCCSFFADSLIDQTIARLQPEGPTFLLWSLEEPVPAWLEAHVKGRGLVSMWTAWTQLAGCCSGSGPVCFISDDMEIVTDNYLVRMVGILEEFSADVVLSAFTLDSFGSHVITVQRPRLRARLTNFIEYNAVVVSRRFLDRFLPFPAVTVGGWGVDFYLSQKCMEEGFRMVIADCCPVRNRYRPVASRYSRDEAMESCKGFLKENGIPWPYQPKVLERFV